MSVDAAQVFGVTDTGRFSVRVAAVNANMFEVVRVAGDTMGRIADTYVNGDKVMDDDTLRVYNTQSMVVTVALTVTDIVADTDMTPAEILAAVYALRDELRVKGVTDTAVLTVVVNAYDTLHGGYDTLVSPVVNPDAPLTLNG